MNIDFTDVKDGFTLLEDGTYDATITACEIKLTKDKQSKIVAFTYEAENEEGEKVKIFDNCSLKQNALWNLKQKLERLGFDVSGNLEFEPDDVIDMECMIKVNSREYQGKTYNNIVAINPEDDE